MMPWQYQLCGMNEMERRDKELRAAAGYATDEREYWILDRAPQVPTFGHGRLRHRFGLLLIAAGVALLDRPRDVAYSA